jgi:glycosyltransferase involved in cell wall biosynthesis
MSRGAIDGARVYLMTPVLAPHDAIGNDVAGMAACLRRNGCHVETYAETVDAACQCDAKPVGASAHKFWQDADALLIYHHSMAWPNGFEILKQRRARLAVKHHNVTPPRFFTGHSPEHVLACEAGERATSELAAMRDMLFWADSQFNAADVIERGAREDTCRVVPPFHVVEHMAGTPPDRAVIQKYKQHPGTKLLFVGGIKPNKGHRTLIRALATYRRRYDPDAILILAGSLDARLSGYVDALRKLARELRVENAVVFTGPVSDAQLRSFYLVADVFLCLSEHEGFCVPLIEAMYFRTPIVAGASTAVTETVGDAALLCANTDLAGAAENIDRCATASKETESLPRTGWQRYHSSFSIDAIEAQFLSLVREAIAA